MTKGWSCEHSNWFSTWIRATMLEQTLTPLYLRIVLSTCFITGQQRWCSSLDPRLSPLVKVCEKLALLFFSLQKFVHFQSKSRHFISRLPPDVHRGRRGLTTLLTKIRVCGCARSVAVDNGSVLYILWEWAFLWGHLQWHGQRPHQQYCHWGIEHTNCCTHGSRKLQAPLQSKRIGNNRRAQKMLEANVTKIVQGENIEDLKIFPTVSSCLQLQATVFERNRAVTGANARAFRNIIWAGHYPDKPKH